MNQTCKVCGEPAAGFHFGAFTCEGCKSFFGRSYNNLSSISECKNNGKCVIDKKNRTTCKACRLRKCYTVGMSKGGSRYGRRSNWFKIHCLLQEQQQQAADAASKAASNCPLVISNNSSSYGDMAAAVAAQQQFSQRNSQLAGGPHLGYPSYLPDISAPPFMSAAALPFISMMNSLPNISNASSPSAFQVPPHLLFPGYHPAAAAAAADAAFLSGMYKHRQSLDSVESQSPTNHSIHSLTQDESHPQMQQQLQPQESELSSNRESPELCVSGDDDELETNLLHQHHQPGISPVSSVEPVQQQHSPDQHQIHSPIAVRVSPAPQPTSELSFAAKVQSLFPVSVCSISPETSPLPASQLGQPINQDCPIDLSMKTSTSSSNSDCDLLSESCDEPNIQRKFYHSETSTENSENSCDSEAIKRQKLNEIAYSSFTTHHSQRGIVCV